MNLKELATLALDEEIVEDAVKKHSQKKDAESSDSPFAIEENPDGTTTISVLVTFDPKIREEKAKAMAKGVKRDDLADDIPDETPEPAEDSAPRGVFAVALDELAAIAPEIAEDASPRRQHGLSPIENCRAKDPMFCPYHGQAAIKESMEQELQKLGIKSNCTVEVRPEGKDFQLDVIVPSFHPGINMKDIADAMVKAFSSKSGINLVKPPNFYNGYANGVRLSQTRRGDVDSIIVSPSAANKSEQDVAKLDEWIDDLVTDIADDPTLMQDLDPQDVRDLLETRETLDKSAGTPQEDAAYDACREKYHYVRAQVDYRDIKTQGDALNAEATITQDMDALDKDYHSAKAIVDDDKKALFKGGRFPNGFAKAHPWAEKYNKLSTAVGYFAQKKWDDALDANLNVPGNDIKARRATLSAMNYAKELYEQALDKYRKGLPEFMKEFEDWARNDPSIQPAQFQAAFPHSAPKTT